MALLFEPSDTDRKAWSDWVAERPPRIRAVAERLEPWRLYQIGTDGHRVTLRSIEEPENHDAPVTVTVNVPREFNLLVMTDYAVFGIDPNELIECDIPPPPIVLNPEQAQALFREIDDAWDQVRVALKKRVL